jgi:hypothetical protein
MLGLTAFAPAGNACSYGGTVTVVSAKDSLCATLCLKHAHTNIDLRRRGFVKLRSRVLGSLL